MGHSGFCPALSFPAHALLQPPSSPPFSCKSLKVYTIYSQLPSAHGPAHRPAPRNTPQNQGSLCFGAGSWPRAQGSNRGERRQGRASGCLWSARNKAPATIPDIHFRTTSIEMRLHLTIALLSIPPIYRAFDGHTRAILSPRPGKWRSFGANSKPLHPPHLFRRLLQLQPAAAFRSWSKAAIAYGGRGKSLYLIRAGLSSYRSVSLFLRSLQVPWPAQDRHYLLFEPRSGAGQPFFNDISSYLSQGAYVPVVYCI